ncbi:MAG: WecB/TagA/CpsF family glycosyltransferase [Suipraeoptans sp.]
MSEIVDILNIDVSKLSAKEVLAQIISYNKSEAINIIEFLSSEAMITLNEKEELKDSMKSFDLILPGDKAVLEAANIDEPRVLEEAENRMLLKTVFKYMHRNRLRIYLLANTEEETKSFFKYISTYYPNIKLIGMARVADENRADDMLVNAINGSEIEAIISILSTPLQEDFITSNKQVLNAKMWIGIGDEKMLLPNEEGGLKKLAQFVKKKILKKEIQKSRTLL